MSIIAVITDLYIKNPPTWYEGFTSTYLSRPKPHITLLQPRYVTEAEGNTLKEFLSDELKKMGIGLPLDAVAKCIEPFRDGTGFMLGIEHPEIMRLQRALCALMPSGLELVFPAGEEYERNFSPHLTMGDRVPEGELLNLIAQYNLHTLCLDVQVRSVLCTLPKDFSLEESFKEENYHVILQ